MFIDMSAFLVQALNFKAFLPGTLAEIVLCHPHKKGFWLLESLLDEYFFLSIFLVLSSLLPSLADQDSGGRKGKHISKIYSVDSSQVEQLLLLEAEKYFYLPVSLREFTKFRIH